VRADDDLDDFFQATAQVVAKLPGLSDLSISGSLDNPDDGAYSTGILSQDAFVSVMQLISQSPLTKLRISDFFEADEIFYGNFVFPKTLRSLEMSNNIICSQSMQNILAAVPSTLRSLSLHDDCLDEEAFLALSNNMPQNLRKLCLNRNCVSKFGIICLACHLPLLLAELDISGVEMEIDTDVAMMLLKKTSLRKLVLGGNFSPGEKQIITDLAPNTQISF
jgi:hypothetical protein